MWDEKQFFEDYKKESEQIQPDAAFTEKLKALAEEEPKVSSFPKARILAAAASFVLCIGVGAVAWNGVHSGKDSQMEQSYLAGNTADTKDKENDAVQEEAEKNAEKYTVQYDMDDSVQEEMAEKEESVQESAELDRIEPIDQVLDAMRQGADVKDAQGEILSSEAQQELFDLLKVAQRCDDVIVSDEPIEIYQIEGDETFTVERFEDDVIQIDGISYMK